MKKSNEKEQKKLDDEIGKIKSDFKKKIDLVKKSAEDEKDRAVTSAAYRRKQEVEREVAKQLKEEKKKIQKEWLRRDKNLQDREDAYYKIYKFTKEQEDNGYDRAMSRTY